MDRQRGRRVGINTAALDMALASIRSQAISKVLTAVGIFAARVIGPDVVEALLPLERAELRWDAGCFVPANVGL
jgi:hypothetical protein